ncbi:thioesterase superfamily [Fusarium albosuccineum]|uniref:Thioesterase superfamily n=1 Tax=Fusarium albosuccineum TaxID=1237068 RepID=A0A8H4KPE8_9HYPO|nr:thioesterase superfamily [Fusarium albosuccineum]
MSASARISRFPSCSATAARLARPTPALAATSIRRYASAPDYVTLNYPKRLIDLIKRADALKTTAPLPRQSHDARVVELAVKPKWRQILCGLEGFLPALEGTAQAVAWGDVPLTYPDWVRVHYKLGERPDRGAKHLVLEAIFISVRERAIVARSYEVLGVHDYSGRRKPLPDSTVKEFWKLYMEQQKYQAEQEEMLLRLETKTAELEAQLGVGPKELAPAKNPFWHPSTETPIPSALDKEEAITGTAGDGEVKPPTEPKSTVVRPQEEYVDLLGDIYGDMIKGSARTVKDPVEQLVEDAAENVAEDTKNNAVGDIVEDPIKGAAENTAENAVKDPVEDAAENVVQDTANDALRSTVGDPIADSMGDTAQGTVDETPRPGASLSFGFSSSSGGPRRFGFPIFAKKVEGSAEVKPPISHKPTTATEKDDIQDIIAQIYGETVDRPRDSGRKG